MEAKGAQKAPNLDEIMSFMKKNKPRKYLEKETVRNARRPKINK